MGLSRRLFTKEFKLAAVRRLEQGTSIGEAARALEVNPNVLHRLRREFRTGPGNAFPGNGKQRWAEGRIAELERKIGQQALEIDFLKGCLQRIEEQRMLQVLTGNPPSNGAYTVTPSKSGFTFTPANQAATINNANQTTINFTAQGQTWSISGTISPSANGSGATMTLSGAATATVTADSSGNYTFSGLSNGDYTITPGKSGFTFTPASQSGTVSGSNLTGINFSSSQNATGSLTVDVTVWQDQHTPSSTVVSPAFSTASGNELLLAFIGTDYASGLNTTVTSVSGGGLTWVLAARTNVQSGTSEIWRAFAANPLSNVSVTVTLSQSVASSMTVMSFTGVDTSGTNGSGAIGAIGSGNAGFGGPTATLVTTGNNSWVFGVGNDFTNAIARAPGSGQTLVHQDLPNTPGVAVDTFWVQRQNSPTPLSGTSVTINDTSPTSDEYNLSTVEILPALSTSTQTLSISGPVSPSAIRNSQAVGSGAIQAASLALSNTATGVAGDACSPGGLATIFGTGFTAGTAQQATSLPLPQQLGGVLVKVNGIAEPLLFVSDSQINFQCPQLPAGSPLHIVLQGESGALSIDSVMRIPGARRL